MGLSCVGSLDLRLNTGRRGTDDHGTDGLPAAKSDPNRVVPVLFLHLEDGHGHGLIASLIPDAGRIDPRVEAERLHAVHEDGHAVVRPVAVGACRGEIDVGSVAVRGNLHRGLSGDGERSCQVVVARVAVACILVFAVIHVGRYRMASCGGCPCRLILSREVAAVHGDDGGRAAGEAALALVAPEESLRSAALAAAYIVHIKAHAVL